MDIKDILHEQQIDGFMNPSDDLENLLNSFSSNQVKLESNGTVKFQGEQLLSEGSSRKAGLDQISFLEDNSSLRTPGETSLNSSGYISSGSPDSLTNSATFDLSFPDFGKETSVSSVSSVSSVAGIKTENVAKVEQVSVSLTPLEGSNLENQSVISVNVPTQSTPFSLSITSPSPGVSSSLSESRGWVQRVYPELFRVWSQNSASQLYQGGVRMLCSACKKEPGAGFHEGLPVCVKCKTGAACTICRLRLVFGFSFGLAICEADKVFLFRCFNNKTVFRRCESSCPVTVQRWCSYCRLKTCLETRGFRFHLNEESKKRSATEDSSREVKVSKLSSKENVNPKLAVAQTQPPPTSSVSSPTSSSSPFVHPSSIITHQQTSQSVIRSSSVSRDSLINIPVHVVGHDTGAAGVGESVQQCYDGAALGGRDRRGSGF